MFCTGTNNARLGGMLRQLAMYYHKDANNLFMVRLAQVKFLRKVVCGRHGHTRRHSSFRSNRKTPRARARYVKAILTRVRFKIWRLGLYVET